MVRSAQVPRPASPPPHSSPSFNKGCPKRRRDALSRAGFMLERCLIFPGDASLTRQPPFQNDSGPLKDDRPSDGDTPSCEIAAARAGRRGGRRDAIVLGFEITGIRSPAAGATDGTGSNEAARVHHASRRRGSSSWPLAARAQQPAMPVIGFLNSSSPDAVRRASARVSPRPERNRLCRGPERHDRIPLGGRANTIGCRRWRPIWFAAGGRDRRRPGTPATLAAKAATTTIPIVFTIGTDPVELGLVASLNRPGGNVTGVTSLNVELAPKRLELLHELVP